MITLVPTSISFAQTISSTSTASDIVATGLFYIKRLMVLAIAAAVLMFVYALVKYISSDEEINKSKSKHLILNTIIALVAASSLWGIIAIIQNTIGGTGTLTNSGSALLTSCPTQANAFTTVTQTIRFVTCFIAGKLFPFVIALAVLYYVFTAFQLVQNAENESKRKQYQESLFWGVIFIAVMVSIWALVALVTNTIGTSGSTFFLPQ